jgi:hypothetical protein
MLISRRIIFEKKKQFTWMTFGAASTFADKQFI